MCSSLNTVPAKTDSGPLLSDNSVCVMYVINHVRRTLISWGLGARIELITMVAFGKAATTVSTAPEIFGCKHCILPCMLSYTYICNICIVLDIGWGRCA